GPPRRTARSPASNWRMASGLTGGSLGAAVGPVALWSRMRWLDEVPHAPSASAPRAAAATSARRCRRLLVLIAHHLGHELGPQRPVAEALAAARLAHRRERARVEPAQRRAHLARVLVVDLQVDGLLVAHAVQLDGALLDLDHRVLQRLLVHLGLV